MNQVPPLERAARELNDRMVDLLVQRALIRQPRVEGAFRTVRRHRFLPDTPLDEVYRDRAVVTHRGPGGVPVSSSSQPAVMALMLEQLRVEPGLAVLEIGTGTGFNAALLGHLVGPDGDVVTVDVDPAIVTEARRHLIASGASNVSVIDGDGWAAVSGAATFDRIEATACVWDISPAWVEHLSPGGVLVAPVWLGVGVQASIAFRHGVDGRLESLSVEPCGFMRMRGPGNGQPTDLRVGPWTVTVNRPIPGIAGIVTALLQTDPRTEGAPVLDPAWFKRVALSEPDAIHLFSHGPEGPVSWAGILDLSGPGLAVVESQPLGSGLQQHIVRSFGTGSAQPRGRLLELIRTGPIDLRRVAVAAIPVGRPVDGRGALGTLARPNFTLVIRSAVSAM